MFPFAYNVLFAYCLFSNNILRDINIEGFVLGHICPKYDSEHGYRCNMCPAGICRNGPCTKPNGLSDCRPCPPNHYQSNCIIALSFEPCGTDCTKHRAVVEEWCTAITPTRCICSDGNDFIQEVTRKGTRWTVTVTQFPDDSMKSCKSTTKCPTRSTPTQTHHLFSENSTLWGVVIGVTISALVIAIIVVCVIHYLKWMCCFKECGRKARHRKEEQTTNMSLNTLNGTFNIANGDANFTTYGNMVISAANNEKQSIPIMAPRNNQRPEAGSHNPAGPGSHNPTGLGSHNSTGSGSHNSTGPGSSNPNPTDTLPSDLGQMHAQEMKAVYTSIRGETHGNVHSVPDDDTIDNVGVQVESDNFNSLNTIVKIDGARKETQI